LRAVLTIDRSQQSMMLEVCRSSAAAAAAAGLDLLVVVDLSFPGTWHQRFTDARLREYLSEKNSFNIVF